MCARQVDEAAAKLKMEITSKPQHLDEIDRKILQLEMERLSLAKVGLHAQHPLKLTLGMPLLCMSVGRHRDRAVKDPAAEMERLSLARAGWHARHPCTESCLTECRCWA